MIAAVRMTVAGNSARHPVPMQSVRPRAPDRGLADRGLTSAFSHEGRQKGLTMCHCVRSWRAETHLGPRGDVDIWSYRRQCPVVAVQLARTASRMAEIAEANGVNISTLRAQLRSVSTPRPGTGQTIPSLGLTDLAAPRRFDSAPPAAQADRETLKNPLTCGIEGRRRVPAGPPPASAVCMNPLQVEACHLGVHGGPSYTKFLLTPFTL